MEFKEAMRIWKRICNPQDDCEHCPLGRGCPCEMTPICIDMAKFEAILAKWEDEHPEKTIADDFFEKHPNAPRDDKNTPYTCAKDCGYSKPPYCERVPFNCDNCWRRPLEEVE